MCSATLNRCRRTLEEMLAVSFLMILPCRYCDQIPWEKLATFATQHVSFFTIQMQKEQGDAAGAFGVSPGME